jgi:hypothetical protein
MLEPGAGPAGGLLRPSAPAISLTAQLRASGLNGVLAANEPANHRGGGADVHALRNALPQVTGYARLRRGDHDTGFMVRARPRRGTRFWATPVLRAARILRLGEDVHGHRITPEQRRPADLPLDRGG